MKHVRQPQDELRELLRSLAEGSAAADGVRRIDELARADQRLLREYIEYMRLISDLRFGPTNQRSEETLSRLFSLEAQEDSGLWPVASGQGVQSRESRVESEVEYPEITKSLNSQIPTLHSPLSTLHSWAFSYAVATLLLSIALLSAWFSTITHYDADSFVKNNRRVTPSGDANKESSQFTFVGKVSGMVDCQFADSSTSTVSGAAVSLGRRYALKSGLMEIAYDSGAKVILQGPCDYMVETQSSGYLHVGKLVAQVGARGGGRGTGEQKEERGERREESAKNQKSEIINHKSSALTLALSGHHEVVGERGPKFTSSRLSTLNSPLFAVRTPTALVTDLGTEFGVEVSDSGETASHVFRGSVKVQTVGGDDGRRHQNIVLRENESARVEQGDNQVIEVRKTAVNPDTFARRMPDPPPVIFLHDNFENQVDSTTFGEAGEYGLNECLSTRQSGVYRRIPYYRGGDFSRAPCTTQVNHAICPGKLNLIADHGQAGWVSLNCNFPCDVEVSVELEPNALRCADKSPLPKTVQGDPDGESWMALGIRGQNYQLDHRELPLASNAGAAIQVHANGRWSCFENGKPIAEGRVAPARPYRVTIRAVHDRLEIWINGSALNLDPVGGGPVRTLTGRLAEPKDNYISIGACNMDGELPSDGPMLNSADNLIVRSARPCPDEPEPQQKGEPPPNSP